MSELPTYLHADRERLDNFEKIYHWHLKTLLLFQLKEMHIWSYQLFSYKPVKHAW